MLTCPFTSQLWKERSHKFLQGQIMSNIYIYIYSWRISEMKSSEPVNHATICHTFWHQHARASGTRREFRWCHPRHGWHKDQKLEDLLSLLSLPILPAPFWYLLSLFCPWPGNFKSWIQLATISIHFPSTLGVLGWVALGQVKTSTMWSLPSECRYQGFSEMGSRSLDSFSTSGCWHIINWEIGVMKTYDSGSNLTNARSNEARTDVIW